MFKESFEMNFWITNLTFLHLFSLLCCFEFWIWLWIALFPQLELTYSFNLSTIGADIFMELMKDELIVNIKAIKFYRIHIDDIFMIIRARKATNILQFLNSFDKNVQFT